MRELTVCFAIAYLALASGAPADEKSTSHTKSYDIGDKQVLHSYQSFSNDEFVYLACEGFGDDKKCKISSTSQDPTNVHSCDINNLKYSLSYYNVTTINAGNSRAVIAVRDGETKVRLISVHLKDCKVKETSIDVQRLRTNNIHPLMVFVVPHENNFDVVYKNKEICPSFCKATIDYEGKVVKAAAEFHAKPFEEGYMQIEELNQAYLVAENTDDAGVVLLTKDGDKEPIILYEGKEAEYGLSVAENKFGYCVKRDYKLACKQYDTEGRNKIIDVEILNGVGDLEFLEILNLEKGFITMTIDITEITPETTILVAHFDEQGKQVKSLRVDPVCNENSRIIPKLYKNASGQYCVTSLCVPFHENAKDKTKFAQTTRCFLQNELF